MKKIILSVLLVTATFISQSQTIYSNYTDGKIYVRLKSGTAPSFAKNRNWNNLPIDKFGMIQSLVSSYSINKISKPFYAAKGDEALLNTYLFSFSQFNRVDNLIAELKSNQSIELVEKVPLMKSFLTPNDYATTGGNAQWHLQKIGGPAAWDVFSTGSTIAVAVVDNAMQVNHPDLTANMYVNPGEIANNGIDDDNNGYIDDVTGYDVADDDNNASPPDNSFDHGTHCSGLVSARANNGTGIASIGFSVKIIPVKSTMDASGATAVDAGYAGIIYSVNAKARVISCSWGGGGSSVTEQAVINYAWNRNAIVVAAAGNDNSTTQSYPGAYANVYCVASTTTTDARSGFSNYGTWVDISAPGSNIRSTLPGSTYGSMSGTSMATPIVAGLCGLVLSAKPYLTPTQVLSCISTTAATLTTSGMGAGRIDAAAAMACAASANAGPPNVNFYTQTPVTCPGAPVKFYDQTYFGATSWAWTFAGATPSTSTAQNPTVTYAAAGTYSVQLTATNPNGSGTQTKTSYITVAGPTTLPLSEGFTNATYPPAGWSEFDFYVDSVKWYRNTSVGGYGTSTKCIYFDNYNSDTRGKADEIRTPKYNFSALSTAQLTFDLAYARYDAEYSDSLKVLVSTDCGATWSQVYFKGGTGLATAPDNTTAVFVPANNEWRTETVSLTSFVGQGSVLVSFQNIGRYGQALYVDNINITGITAGAPPVAGFTASANTCTNQIVSLTDNSTNNPTTWAWTTSGGTLSANNVQNPTVTFNAGGTYTLSLVATNAFGASTPSAQIITVNQTPTAVASATGPFCIQGQVALSASGGSSYSWVGPGAFTSTVQNPTRTNANFAMAGVYTVTVTDNGCSSTATTSVTIANKPTSLITGSNAFCAGNSVTLSGSTSAGGGSYTIASYQWQLTGAPIVGANTVSYTATQAGVYSLIVTNSGGCTTTSANKTITVNALPTVVATSTTVCNGESATINASGANTFVWDAGSTTSSLTINPATTTTTYTVTGTTTTTGCTNTATGVITVNSLPTVVSTSTTVCSGDVATLNASGASSFVWSAGATTSDLTINPATTTTTYTVTGTDVLTGCTNTATGVINVNTPSVPTVSQVGTTLTSSVAVSYQWYLDGNLIAGETNQTIEALQNGDYTVETTDANGCSAISSLVTISSIGISEIKNSIKASMFPNPTTGMFAITIELDAKQEYKLLVTDVLGRVVIMETISSTNHFAKQYDLTDKANGVYNISIQSSSQGKWVERIILNK
jgi:serine protease